MRQLCAGTCPERRDILITKDGTLGVIRAIRTDAVFSIFVSLALIKPVDRTMTDYLEMALCSPQVQQQMVGVGTGLQHIHLTDLRRDLIPVAPAAERDQIVLSARSLLKCIDKSLSEASRAEALLDRLEQATLAKAFRGDLMSPMKSPPGAADSASTGRRRTVLRDTGRSLRAGRSRTVLTS